MKFIYHSSFGSKTPDRHQRRNLRRAGTVVIDAPEMAVMVDAAVKFITSGRHPVVEVGIGIATVHPDDQFSKKKGIETAEKNSQTVVFKVLNLEVQTQRLHSQTTMYLSDGVNHGLQVIFNSYSDYYRVKYFSIQEGDMNGSN